MTLLQLLFMFLLLINLPGFHIERHQKNHDIAAYILTKSEGDCHISLKPLHWLPNLFRVRIKILVLNVHAYHGVAPDYIRELITKHHAIRRLTT